MVKIGDNAPETVMEGSNGQSFRLTDFKGKKVVLVITSYSIHYTKLYD